MSKLVVITHKACWVSAESPTGYVTDGGFPFQMEALSELFDSTTLLLTRASVPARGSEIPLRGDGLSVVPLSALARSGVLRRLLFPFWFLRNSITLAREIARADGVHALVPGDVGTLGMVLSVLLGKPLFVRHCGNWLEPGTGPERFCRWFMERFGGGRNVMLATGGGLESPSRVNPDIEWIFSSSLRQRELAANSLDRPARVPGVVRLILTARQTRAKGTGTVIASLPVLMKRFAGIRFDVVGDGPERARFEVQARELGVGDRVVFHGKVDHATVLRLLREADVFCFPTTSSEGFPKAVLEALSCGLPVVTTRVSVLPLLIGERCGVVLDEATPPAVASAVASVLEDPVRLALMREAAVRTAAEYSLERWRDQIGKKLTKGWTAGLLKAPLPVPAGARPGEGS